ncbi:hypothetical protein C2845_PM06G06370 [Panicum miliaceum]|uniref:GDSL esterase/lipase n=1 Tax=Panicum miliaceum TaxID=4540 RepID=A0A3L6RA49_PANMI|nr:hypothetical protein C2845_PM06G06370 [Panicum miliaceum]
MAFRWLQCSDFRARRPTSPPPTGDPEILLIQAFRKAVSVLDIGSDCSTGIEWLFMLCCGNGGPPNKFKPGNPCGDLCLPETKVISWDGVHFTYFGSSLAAKLARSGE